MGYAALQTRTGESLAAPAKPRLDAQLSVLERIVRAVLISPPALAAKAVANDVIWTFAGRGLSNPMRPASVRSLLFVCKGNICRSPFAALRTQALLAESGSRIACRSAGIETIQASRSPQIACEAAAAFGVTLDAHEPLQLTRALVTQFDLIVVMEASQLRHLRETYPEAAARIWLLSLLDGRRGYARFHIADPFGRARSTFDACYQRIDAALRPLVQLITSSQGNVRP